MLVDENMSISEPLTEINIGKRQIRLSICHQIPERSLIIADRTILCWRCTGVYTSFILLLLIQISGILFGILSGLIFDYYEVLTFNHLGFEILLVLGLHIPLVIDGTVQAISSYESNNYLRFSTGLLAGIGQYTLYLLLGSLYFKLI